MGILKWEVFLESHGFSYLEVERSAFTIHGLEGVPFDNLFTFHNTITRGNGYKLFKHFCHLNVRKFSFAQRIIDDWNQLPTFLIESPDILTFKTKLDIFLEC